MYDKYDKQNGIKATKCLLNSLNSELCKDIMAQTDEEMLFSQVFMIIIEHERRQHGELYDAIKQQLLNMDVGKFPGANIKDMCIKMQKDTKALIKANQYNSKHNLRICRMLTEAGGINNSKYSNPMYVLLTKVKREIPKHNHLSNADKLTAMSKEEVGWEDILQEAKDMYQSMTAEGYIRWPPACNPSNSKVPPNNFGANLTQINNGKHSNGNGKNIVRKNQKHKNGNGNHSKNGNGNHNRNSKKEV